jgi:glucose dehydrogenase
MSAGESGYFCPGAVGGAEWNGVAYHPPTNLIFTGEDDWCTVVKLMSDADVKAIPKGIIGWAPMPRARWK